MKAGCGAALTRLLIDRRSAAGRTGGEGRHALRVELHSLVQLDGGQVDSEDSFPAREIGAVDADLSVEAPWPKQRLSAHKSR